MIGLMIFLMTTSVTTSSSAITTVMTGSCTKSAATRNTATIASDAICRTDMISAYILLTSAVILL